MNRNGKIARLPRGIREELNRRLQNGEPGEPLLDWLNPLPEVQMVLRAEFAGVPISKQNLSEWRKGGFVEWEFKGDCRQDAQETAADAEEIAATAGRPPDGGSSKDQHPTSKEKVRPAACRSDERAGGAVKVSQTTFSRREDRGAGPVADAETDASEVVKPPAPSPMASARTSKKSNPVKPSQTTFSRHEDRGVGPVADAEADASEVATPPQAAGNGANPKVGPASKITSQIATLLSRKAE